MATPTCERGRRSSKANLELYSLCTSTNIQYIRKITHQLPDFRTRRGDTHKRYEKFFVRFIYKQHAGPTTSLTSFQARVIISMTPRREEQKLHGNNIISDYQARQPSANINSMALRCLFYILDGVVLLISFRMSVI